MQSAVQKIVVAAGKIVYTPQISQQLLKMVGGAPDPIMGVVAAVKLIVGQLQERSSGIPPEALGKAVPVVAVMVLELAEAAKLVKFDQGLLGEVLQALGGASAEQTTREPAQDIEELPAGEQPVDVDYDDARDAPRSEQPVAEQSADVDDEEDEERKGLVGSAMGG